MRNVGRNAPRTDSYSWPGEQPVPLKGLAPVPIGAVQARPRALRGMPLWAWRGARVVLRVLVPVTNLTAAISAAVFGFDTVAPLVHVTATGSVILAGIGALFGYAVAGEITDLAYERLMEWIDPKASKKSPRTTAKKGTDLR
jgi:hypothetical protein